MGKHNKNNNINDLRCMINQQNKIIQAQTEIITRLHDLRCRMEQQNKIIQAQKEIITKLKLHKATLITVTEFAQQELTRFLEIFESRWILFNLMSSKGQHITNQCIT